MSDDALAVWDTGNVYRGGLKDGLPHGKGKMTLASGDVYEGGVKRGVRHGHGKQTTRDGAVYEGQWSMHVRHGHGKCSFDNHLYVGQWRKDMKHGYGKETCKGEEGFVYEGEFKHGKRDGHGKYTDSDLVYEGDFNQGKIHGWGVMKRDNTTYTGKFKNNERHGLFRCEYYDTVISFLVPDDMTDMEAESVAKHLLGLAVIPKELEERLRAKTRARWQRSIRAVIKQLHEDKVATERNAVESAKQKAVRDAIKRDMATKAMREAAELPSTTLPRQGRESHRVPRKAPDAAASAVRLTEKEANLARLHEQTVARCAKEDENRAQLAEREASIRIGFQINEEY